MSGHLDGKRRRSRSRARRSAQIAKTRKASLLQSHDLPKAETSGARSLNERRSDNSLRKALKQSLRQIGGTPVSPLRPSKEHKDGNRGRSRDKLPVLSLTIPTSTTRAPNDATTVVADSTSGAKADGRPLASFSPPVEGREGVIRDTESLVTSVDALMKKLNAAREIHPVISPAVVAFRDVWLSNIYPRLQVRDERFHVLCHEIKQVMDVISKVVYIDKSMDTEDPNSKVVTNQLATIVKAIEMDITAFGHVCDTYWSQRHVVRIFKNSAWNTQFAKHSTIFMKRRAELESILSVRTTPGVIDIGNTHKLLVEKTMEKFWSLSSPKEKQEAASFIQKDDTKVIKGDAATKTRRPSGLIQMEASTSGAGTSNKSRGMPGSQTATSVVAPNLTLHISGATGMTATLTPPKPKARRRRAPLPAKGPRELRTADKRISGIKRDKTDPPESPIKNWVVTGLMYKDSIRRDMSSPLSLGSVGAQALERRVERLVDTSVDLMEALDVAQDMYPVTLPVILAFKAIWALGFRRKDNKTLALFVVIRETMSALRHSLEGMNGSNKFPPDDIDNRMGPIIQGMTEDIVACANGCDTYLKQRLLVKVLNSPAWNAQLATFAGTFAKRRYEIESALAAGMTSVDQSLSSAETKTQTEVMVERMIKLFEHSALADEDDLGRLVQLRGGRDVCREKDDLLMELIDLEHQQTDASGSGRSRDEPNATAAKELSLNDLKEQLALDPSVAMEKNMIVFLQEFEDQKRRIELSLKASPIPEELVTPQDILSPPTRHDEQSLASSPILTQSLDGHSGDRISKDLTSFEYMVRPNGIRSDPQGSLNRPARLLPNPPGDKHMTHNIPESRAVPKRLLPVPPMTTPNADRTGILSPNPIPMREIPTYSHAHSTRPVRPLPRPPRHDFVITQLSATINGLEPPETVTKIEVGELEPDEPNTSRSQVTEDPDIVEVTDSYPPQQGTSNSNLNRDLELAELAKRASSFSGAVIAGLVEAAKNIALGSQSQLENQGNEISRSRQFTERDFQQALMEVAPARNSLHGELGQAIPHGIIAFDLPSYAIKTLLRKGKLYAKQVSTGEELRPISILLHGPPETGKTALAVTIARESNFPFIKLISPDKVLGYSQPRQVIAINEAFAESRKSALSVIVIDDLEQLLGWDPINQNYSMNILQALSVHLQRPPPKGQGLLIIATSSNRSVLTRLQLLKLFDAQLLVPPISTLDAIRTVLREVRLFPTVVQLEFAMARIQERVSHCGKDPGKVPDIGIKRLLRIIAMAKQESSWGDVVERLVEELLDNITDSEAILRTASSIQA